MKNKETLEEAAISYLDRTYNLSYERTTWQKLHEKTFIAGAKWQQERMYSEEEVLEIIDLLFHRYASSFRIDAKEYFLQFKKK